MSKVITNLSYDKGRFDYKDIFLHDAEGKKDTHLASLYENDREKFMADQVEDTKNAFADIDPNRRDAATLDKIEAIAETVYSKVKRGVKVYNPVPLIYDVQKGELGKTLEAHEILGGKVYNYSYGGVRRMSGLEHKTYTITTKPASVHFALPVEQMRVGRYTMSDLVFAATQAIIRYKTKLAYNTFVAAYPTSATAYVSNNNNATLQQSILEGAIDAVAAYGVSAITVVGRKSKLNAVNDFTGSNYQHLYPDAVLMDMHKKGYVTTFRGANLIGLATDEDEVYDTEAFGSSSVFLVSQEKSFNRFVEVGGIARSAWIEPGTKTFHMMFDFEDGAAIWKQKYGHRIYGVSA